MNASSAMQQSATFFAASERCLTERKCGDQTLFVLLVPGIVCSVLSIELGFKALSAASERKPAKEHNLLELFKNLNGDMQGEIVSALGMEKREFTQAIEDMSHALQQWRYIYEYPDTHINLGFLDRLARSVQQEMNRVLGST